MLRTQVPGGWIATDRLTGETLGALANGLTLTVPAGSLSLLIVKLAPP